MLEKYVKVGVSLLFMKKFTIHEKRSFHEIQKQIRMLKVHVKRKP